MLRNCCSLLVFALISLAPLAAHAGDGAKKEKQGAAQVEAKKKPDANNVALAEKKPRAEKQAKAAKAKKKADAEKRPDATKKAQRDQAAKANKPKAAAGLVKSVDATAKSITITKTNKKQQTSEDVTLTIANDATVVIAGQVKALSDVAVGKRARLMLSQDGTKVISIQMGGKKKADKPAA